MNNLNIMKFYLSTLKLLTMLSQRKLINGVILLLGILTIFSFIQIPSAFALTAREYCETLSSQAINEPPFHLKSPKQSCLDDLDIKAWNTCISEPPEKRGACSEKVRNEEADKTEKIPDSIKNPDREKIVNCKSGTAQCLKDNPLIYWTKRLINFLAIGVGVVVTISIIIGGIQYSAAGSNPQAMAAAKKRITNALLALVAYMFLYGFVEYLIPGGFI